MGSLRVGSCLRKVKKNEEGEEREVGDRVGVPWRPDSDPGGGPPSGRTSLSSNLLALQPPSHSGDKSQGRNDDHLS